MKHHRTISACLLFLCLIVFGKTVWAQTADEKFNSFGTVKCDEELAILDGIEQKLKAEPFITAYFYIYGGRRDTRRGEVQIRETRMKRYLTETRGVEPNRVEMVATGFREKFTVDVWFVSVGETPPKPSSTVPDEKVKFKKGKMPQWEEPGCYAFAPENRIARKNRKCEN